MRAGREELPSKLFYLLRVGHRATYREGGYCEPILASCATT